MSNAARTAGNPACTTLTTPEMAVRATLTTCENTPRNVSHAPAYAPGSRLMSSETASISPEIAPLAISLARTIVPIQVSHPAA